jgi:hypothetical protein
MSETSLPLPLDALGPVPKGSPAAPRVGKEAATDQGVSEFCLMLVAELAQGKTVTDGAPAPEGAGASPVDPAADSKDLPPPSGMPLPVDPAADGKDLPPPSGMPLPLPMGQTAPPAPPAEGVAAEDGAEPAKAAPAAPPPVRVATAGQVTPGAGEGVGLHEGGQRAPELQPAGTAAPPKELNLDTERGVIATHATDAPQHHAALGPEQPQTFQADLHSMGAPTDQAPPGPAAHRPSVPLAEPLHTPRWGEGFADHVTWMVKQDLQQAELRLHPPDLGPLEVRIAVSNDEARIAFTAQHALVRDAVEAALPRLRELLTANGLNLVQVDVGQQGPGGEQGAGPGTRPDTAWPVVVGGGQPDDAVQERPVVSSLHEGLVDDYA